MKYTKPEVKALGTAIEAIQSQNNKPIPATTDHVTMSLGNDGPAYEADE